jgi:hypothetical protein
MKTKRFLLAVACATMTFTFFACSDDKDEPTYTYGTGACYAESVPIGEDTKACLKFYIDVTAEFCEQSSLTYREDCPPNPTLKCEQEKKGRYFYGTLPPGFSCANVGD